MSAEGGKEIISHSRKLVVPEGWLEIRTFKRGPKFVSQGHIHQLQTSFVWEYHDPPVSRIINFYNIVSYKYFFFEKIF